MSLTLLLMKLLFVADGPFLIIFLALYSLFALVMGYNPYG